MSTSEPPYPDDWNPGETSAIPVGPEPEPTGTGGAGGGAGGWGRAPRVEPFAIAALVWAIVSIVIPLIGTVIALVLAAKAADLIRRSRGEKSGTQYVTAARVVAGISIALWAIGLIAFLALGGNDSSDKNEVAVPTQPPQTTFPVATTITLPPITATTTKPVTTTTTPPPTISVVPPTVPPPTVAPTTAGPPPTTAAPTTAPPTTAPPTTSPDQGKAAAVQAKLLNRPQLGPSNRGVPDDDRFVVTYTPGEDLLVTWSINNGASGPHPTGTPDCAGPPTTAPPTSSTSIPSSTTTSTTTTTTTTPPSSTTQAPGRTTQEQARYEARQILLSIRPQLTSLHLDVPGVQLVGTYPIDADGDTDVVQVLYSKAAVQSVFSDYKKAFDVPPAEVVQCLNPAFDLS